MNTPRRLINASSLLLAVAILGPAPTALAGDDHPALRGDAHLKTGHGDVVNASSDGETLGGDAGLDLVAHTDVPDLPPDDTGSGDEPEPTAFTSSPDDPPASPGSPFDAARDDGPLTVTDFLGASGPLRIFPGDLGRPVADLPDPFLSGPSLNGSPSLGFDAPLDGSDANAPTGGATPSAIPTPGAVTILTIAGAAALRRRRR